jgi:hypothetical protein
VRCQFDAIARRYDQGAPGSTGRLGHHIWAPSQPAVLMSVWGYDAGLEESCRYEVDAPANHDLLELIGTMAAVYIESTTPRSYR